MKTDVQGRLNAHALFLQSDGKPCYHKELKLHDAQEALLRAARDKIREQLRAGFANIQNYVKRDRLFEDYVPPILRKSVPSLAPRFLMQGSFAYRTITQPETSPPQQIDLDDGVYVALDFLSNYGPMLASKALFEVTERCLSPLCQKEGWSLVTDKDTCVRVQITPQAHIDLPLYAVPSDELSRVEKEYLNRYNKALDRRQMLTQAMDSELGALRINGSLVMLAHREKGWHPSDPRKMHDWFLSNVNLHGESLRRVCRYLKGWRDYHWSHCALSSIALMACAVRAFEKNQGQVAANRDDIAVLLTAQELPGLFQGDIVNPVINGQKLNADWSDAERQRLVDAARELDNRMDRAINYSSDEAAVRNIQAAFGERIPYLPTAIVMFPKAAAIIQKEPATVPSPEVGRVKSG